LKDKLFEILDQQLPHMEALKIKGLYLQTVEVEQNKENIQLYCNGIK
jgi:hypothetical protein